MKKNNLHFLNTTDLIQVFANEYISPNDRVLIIGNNNYNNIFKFIGCEFYNVSVYEEPLPFEEQFHVIIDFNGTLNFKEIVILKKVNDTFYTVINGQTEIFGTIPFTK